jgi:SAM-dependent methyltransferase
MAQQACVPACRPHGAARRLAARAASPSVANAAAAPPAAGVYSAPFVYDAAFCRYSQRDFSAEAAFLLRQAAQHAGGAPCTSFLELACGPGRHAHATSALGVRALGLDLSPAMAAYAQGLIPGSAARFCGGDMSRLAAVAAVANAAPFDLVTCLYSSFTHLCTTADALACLRGVHALLSPRGLLALEFEHPRSLFNGDTRRGDGSDDWEVPSSLGFTEEGLALAVCWGAPGDVWDPCTQILHRSVTVDVYEQGAAAPRRAVTEVIPTRLYGVPELHLLAAAAGLRVVATHGALREGVALEDASATRLVMLLAHA